MRRILIVHNQYQRRGGEDDAADREARFLEAAGHVVHRLVRHNDEIAGVRARVATALQTAHSPDGVAMVRDAIQKFRPDVMHVHNWFPLFSPSIHGAARTMGVATVQTLHNYRTLCANGLLMRDGHPCESCIDGSAYFGALHRCYRGSTIGSVVAAHMVASHRRSGTWRRDVDLFLAFSEFARRTFIRGGLPSSRIMVRPNAIDDPGPPNDGARRGVLFVGRFVREKGLNVLLRAVQSLSVEITAIGDGPLYRDIAASAPPNLRLAGRLPLAECRRSLSKTVALVVPSLWYEGFPLMIGEAFAAGVPVIVSRIGGLAEIVRDGETGLHVTPGDPAELANAIERIISDPRAARRMGMAARLPSS